MSRKNKNRKRKSDVRSITYGGDITAQELNKKFGKGWEVVQLPSRMRQIAVKGEAVGSGKGERHTSDEDYDQFENMYEQGVLLRPPYDPAINWRDYEESDALRSAIDARVANIVQPHEFECPKRYKADEKAEAVQAELRRLEDFFDCVNEFGSFLKLRNQLERERHVTKNGYVEVIRNRKHEVERLYNVSSRQMRVTKLDDYPTTISIKIPRNGSFIQIPVQRYFRRFARYIDVNKLVWFKEFGDPRVLDRVHGDYVVGPGYRYYLDGEIDFENAATEIWSFADKWGGHSYGIPDWISTITDIRGRKIAKWVNYDLLDNGAVPPFIILVKGGHLNEGTKKALAQTLKEWSDPKYFNNPAILAPEIDKLNIDLNTGSTKGGADIEIVKMRDDRSNDYMFEKYLPATDDAVGKVLRTPGLIRGDVSNLSNATAYAIMEIYEQQVIAPIRAEFDEKINTELIQREFGIYRWRYKTKRSRIGDTEEFYKAAGMWGRTGGPSINQMLALGNEAMGADWPAYDQDIFNKLPLAVLLALIRSGQLAFNEKGEPVFIPPQGQVPQIPAAKSEKEEKPGRIDITVKHETVKDTPETETNDSGNNGDEKLNIPGSEYEPPEIDEQDLEQ
jgi:capsid portal protein